LSLAVLAGCAGDGPPGTASASLFTRVQSEIFNQKCVSAGCHNPQSNAGNLILAEGFSFAALVEVVADNPVAAARGLSRVTPFLPAQSFLLTKVTGPGAGEGNQMPLGAAPLSETDVSLIESWILSGAPRADGTLIGTPTLLPSAGAASPTATPTRTPTATATAVPATATPSPTTTPSATATVALPTATGTIAATATATATPTTSPTASATATIAAYTFAELQTEILTPRCATMFCHDAQAMSGSLVLAADVSYDELVGAVPDNAAAGGDGLLRVEAFVPDNSFLLVKLGAPPREYGSPMPLTGTQLSEEEILLIRGWIESGAPR
jgi:hypothetical protein